MNTIHTGKDYVEAITALQSDRRARSAFQELVLKVASPGATLFDFGAGPGIDARFYAERGFTVDAYDVDPGMSEYFAGHCREFIQTGRIALETGSYRDFLANNTVAGGRRVELIISNMAPLNHIERLQELFAKFHALTGPDGKVLASVLSPYFIGDLRYPWWWRNAARLWRAGHFSVPGAQGPIVRRRLADFATQSAPYFTLERVFRGLPPSSRRDAHGIDATRHGRYAWLHVLTCRFMILLFQKRHNAQ
jgi:SAM-dependent methyltransferase